MAIDAGEDVFCIDSKPVPVCRNARAKRCKLGKNDYRTAPSFGYCAAQDSYYYGYKLHAVCGIRGVIHSYELSKANVHDLHYLNDIKYGFHNCTMIGDKGYLCASVQLDLFETANMRWFNSANGLHFYKSDNKRQQTLLLFLYIIAQHLAHTWFLVCFGA